jgi:hypothetical protein
MRSDAITIHLGAGRARMQATDMRMRDFFNIPNALFRFLDPPSVAATASFDITWSRPITDRSHVRDRDVGFEGTFILNQATMTWSARGADRTSFVSNPSGTSSFFAQLGHMRNGVFFDH